MVRFSDPKILRAHQARFDPGALSREGLDPLTAGRLDVLLGRALDDLSAKDVAFVLDVLDRVDDAHALFAYFLPAILRRPPWQDVVACERLLSGIERARGDAAAADWDAEVDATLLRWLSTRPLRGGDDPVDLYLTDAGLRRHEIEAARRLPSEVRLRSCLGMDWRRAAEGPLYPRVALHRLDRTPERAVARLAALERGHDANLARAWVEVEFHAHGIGWRPGSRDAVDWLDAPARGEFAEALLSHAELDIALGAAGVLLLMVPRRARELRARAALRLAALDGTDSDRFVLTPVTRRLLEG